MSAASPSSVLPAGSPSAAPPIRIGAFLLGFALAGFFDGILLHQILQWHHLLSGLDGARFAAIGTQVLADGVFHAVMYVIGIAGLWLLLRHRGQLGQTRATALAGHALIGFAAWQVLDVVAVHWVLGLHRVRMDASMPLVWDIGWLVVFGVATGAWGRWLLSRNPPAGNPPGTPWRGTAAGGTLGAVVLAAAVLNLAPVSPITASGAGDGAGQVTLVTLPGDGARSAYAFAQRYGAAIIEASSDGTVWLINVPAGASRMPRYADGAWVVAAGGWGGCASWLAAR
jgi:uncharacterized membrane protein